MRLGGWDRQRRERQSRRLPEKYLDGGYFREDAVIKDRLIAEDPQNIVNYPPASWGASGAQILASSSLEFA